MIKLRDKINTWIFDLDNTLYSADSGIFQQVHILIGNFVSQHLKIELDEANVLQKKYYKQHGTTLRGMMDNHGVDPEYFLTEVHKLDYSIVRPDEDLNQQLERLEGRKIIYTNANRQHADDILERLELTHMFAEIFDIKNANYIPKPEITPYQQFIKNFDIDTTRAIMFDDIAKNLVPAKNVGFTSVWVDAGYENFSDDIASSKHYLDYETKDISNFLYQVNMENV